MQNVTVFASSAEQAKALVRQQFSSFRKGATDGARAYQALPEFSVEKVSLDAHKMITAGITTY
jgi:hypothetical protein